MSAFSITTPDGLQPSVMTMTEFDLFRLTAMQSILARLDVQLAEVDAKDLAAKCAVIAHEQMKYKQPHIVSAGSTPLLATAAANRPEKSPKEDVVDKVPEVGTTQLGHPEGKWERIKVKERSRLVYKIPHNPGSSLWETVGMLEEAKTFVVVWRIVSKKNAASWKIPKKKDGKPQNQFQKPTLEEAKESILECWKPEVDKGEMKRAG